MSAKQVVERCGIDVSRMTEAEAKELYQRAHGNLDEFKEGQVEYRKGVGEGGLLGGYRREFHADRDETGTVTTSSGTYLVERWVAIGSLRDETTVQKITRL